MPVCRTCGEGCSVRGACVRRIGAGTLTWEHRRGGVRAARDGKLQAAFVNLSNVGVPPFPCGVFQRVPRGRLGSGTVAGCHIAMCCHVLCAYGDACTLCPLLDGGLVGVGTPGIAVAHGKPWRWGVFRTAGDGQNEAGPWPALPPPVTCVTPIEDVLPPKEVAVGRSPCMRLDRCRHTAVVTMRSVTPCLPHGSLQQDPAAVGGCNQPAACGHKVSV